jgi:hypothetical protein
MIPSQTMNPCRNLYCRCWRSMTNEQLAYQLLVDPESYESNDETCILKNATDEELAMMYQAARQRQLAEYQQQLAAEQQAATTPKTPRQMEEDEEAKENSKKARMV